jgi:hypothetical protein
MTAFRFGRDVAFLESTEQPHAALVTEDDPDARLMVVSSRSR